MNYNKRHIYYNEITLKLRNDFKDKSKQLQSFSMKVTDLNFELINEIEGKLISFRYKENEYSGCVLSVSHISSSEIMIDSIIYF